MPMISKLLVVVSGVIFVFSGIFIVATIPNLINPDWGLTCPFAFIFLGLSIILLVFPVNSINMSPDSHIKFF